LMWVNSAPTKFGRDERTTQANRPAELFGIDRVAPESQCLLAVRTDSKESKHA
jgi:hypothetical protein